MSTQSVALHRHPLSGHSHRVQLLLSLLGMPVRLVDVDLAGGEHKGASFLALNPFGQDHHGNGRWLPREPAAAAAVQRWLSVAAGQLAFGPARARLVRVFGAPLDAADAIARSHALLGVMEQELTVQAYLAAAHATLADLAMYAYVAHAPEGNVALAAYSNVRTWLQRIESLPGFVPMVATATGLRAA